MQWLAGAGLIVVVCVLSGLPARAELAGVPHVVDGDTLAVDGIEVDIAGIDAPEADQQCQNRRGREYPCGELAARHLRLLVGDHPVTCDDVRSDRDGRHVARCAIGRHDIGRQMVVEGWALSAPTDGVDYAREQQAARGLRDGLWKGRFVMPWDWRRGERLPPVPTSD